MLFIFLSTVLAVKPIYLIAGFGQSPIYSTITEPSLYPECPADINRVLLRTATTTNSDFLDNNIDCVAKMLQVQLNETTGKVEQLPGIITDSSPIGSSSDLSSTFGPLIDKAKTKGYTDNVNLFGVGYNYLLHPVTSFDVYDKLKEKIEQVYTSTNEKAIIISFSQGTSFASIFVSNYSTPEWVKQYIDSVIFLAPAFAGWPLFSQLMNQNVNPFKTSDEMKKSIMRMPGLHIMLPNYNIFSHRTVIYNLNEDFDQHNASYVFEFLKSQGKVDDEAERIYKANVEKYLQVPIPEPPVPSLIVYNDGVTQKVSYVINRHQNNKLTTIFGTPADGTVTSEGPEYACGHWKTTKCKNLHDSTTHNNVIGSQKTLDAVFNFIDSRTKPRNEEPKVGLFLASGFQGSPLYATVTDPEKAPMCPANMKNYLFYTTFIGDIYKYIDDSSSKFWLTDECRAMLTRVELSEDETKTTYAPGIYLQSSRFGEYDRLLSYTSIITRAYEEGYTHYKDLFGVGYNYMLHPLMSGEIYEELKKNIEKYYDETGRKSVLTGHSQGTSFVEIFITDYVTKEWAQKYMAGVIFYAPAFAGWGTYGRLVSGNYGSGFPDSKAEMKTSTSRMPGLHIMMPNEGVYGSKTVIKNFPNDGDQSNASYAGPLLKQLGRMDATAEKIFHLTDKYRKPALPEPPVPSLVIYNDFTNTGNGYTYDKASNSVSQFAGKGDGTVTSDGPDYACSHWENVTCFNYHQSGIGHSNIQTTQKTIDLTFDFLNQVKHTRPLPKNKTYKLEKVSDKYADYSYADFSKVPSNKFTYTNNGGAKENYPITNLFDGNNKTYWISEKTNSDEFLNTITVTFTEPVTLEAILYDTAYSTTGQYREFQGFPTRLNVYTSSNGADFELNSAFIGDPVYPWSRVQFVFPTPIRCDKIKLEFDDVTKQTLSGSSKSVASGNILFIQKVDFDYISNGPVSGVYANTDYVDSTLIPTSDFTYTNNGGSKANYPITNCFDNNNKTYWIADTANSDSFTNEIVITFKKTEKLDAIMYDTAYSTKDKVRDFQGFPIQFNIYTSLDGSEFKLGAIFAGTPVYPWSRIQFVFKETITCDKIKLEFVDVTKQTMSGSSKNPVAGNIILIRHVDPISCIGVEGNYGDSTYVNNRKIGTDKFAVVINGGSKANYPIANVYDGNARSYWVADTPNSDTFINTLIVNFNENVQLEAFLYDTAYATSDQSRNFHGFPTLLNVYKSSGNGKYQLITAFKGNPVFPWTRMQFVFNEPVEMKSLKLEFAQITQQKMVGIDYNPVIAQLLFLKSLNPTSVPIIPTSIVTSPPTKPPTEPPTSVPTSTPTKPPTEPPTSVPTEPPTSVPTSIVTSPPTEPPTSVPTSVPTSIPTSAPTEAPTSNPPTIQPTAVPETCGDDNRCNIEGSETNPVFVTVTTSSFTGYSYGGSGGAVHLVNSGAKCESIRFIKCKSVSGAGGGIYINNKIDMKNDITFDNLVFTECEAVYGSAAFIYSLSTSSSVQIKHCTFASNVASNKRETASSLGGSAIYITAKNGLILECSFTNNKGEGGALRIQNHFDESVKRNNNNKKLEEIIFSVSGCSFLVDKDSSSAVHFVRGRKGTSCELTGCTFSGSLRDGTHFIEGESVSNDSPRLSVKSCKFTETSDRSIDKNNKDDYLEIDISKNEFKKDEPKVEVDNSGKQTVILIAVAAGAVVLIAILIFVLVIILKKKNGSLKIGEKSASNSRYLMDSSLL